MWLGSSVIRVLAQCARRLGFKSHSGYVLFPPVTFGGRRGPCLGCGQKRDYLVSSKQTNVNHKINESPHDKTTKMT